ncbi:hypothetical protein ARMGADRAFT_229293 [Armillaria gallica]|uniref:Fungal-type protein kinase domain-containing protein n=1 Tax=Armillaria gallica TaxID=47427 RepID=A0A2H3E2Z4_ARMGA|nr:hypothetical protein ARMGADRAFT_229293 [Armillaria gallica]
MSSNLRRKSLDYRKQYRRRVKWPVDGRRCSMKKGSRQERTDLRKLGFSVRAMLSTYCQTLDLRSHALVTLIDRDRIQLSYYDRSAIIVSQAIDLGNTDDEILFIAMLIGCHRPILKQRGILHHIIKDPYITDFNRYNKVSKDPKILFSGLEMTLQKDNKDLTLILGTTVYRQRGLFGRDTCVIRATCAEWAGKKLVVKISWPSASR